MDKAPEHCARIVSAVPDIGDKAAREATIARMAYAAGMADERERIRVLVQKVRDANRDAEDGDTFRLLKPGQERAWMALMAGLEGPNVGNEGPAR